MVSKSITGFPKRTFHFHDDFASVRGYLDLHFWILHFYPQVQVKYTINKYGKIIVQTKINVVWQSLKISNNIMVVILERMVVFQLMQYNAKLSLHLGI